MAALHSFRLFGLTLTPLAVGGETNEENLWLACRRCNEFKGTQTHALNAETQESTALYAFVCYGDGGRNKI